MCGRFTLRTPTPVLIKTFRLGDAPALEPRYNVAPTQSIAVVRESAEPGHREMLLMHWGLVPFWAKEPSIGNRMINARCETISEKPAFRAAFRKRRCLVVADGYFEWTKVGSKKQPYWIRMQDERPFAMAGLWEAWYGPPDGDRAAESDPLLSCTIITTDANRRTRDIHDRMPVILDEENWDRWLDRQFEDTQTLVPLLAPFETEEMKAEAVSMRVNNARHDDPECVAIQKELF